jgi:hypothetical protein
MPIFAAALTISLAALLPVLRCTEVEQQSVGLGQSPPCRLLAGAAAMPPTTTKPATCRYVEKGHFLPHAPAAKTARTAPKDVTDQPIGA